LLQKLIELNYNSFYFRTKDASHSLVEAPSKCLFIFEQWQREMQLQIVNGVNHKQQWRERLNVQNQTGVDARKQIQQAATPTSQRGGKKWIRNLAS
jgi:hypothetical protein